jgi:hypothetical protein
MTVTIQTCPHCDRQIVPGSSFYPLGELRLDSAECRTAHALELIERLPQNDPDRNLIELATHGLGKGDHAANLCEIIVRLGARLAMR